MRERQPAPRACPQFKKVRPQELVYFTEDRKCLACQTRYTPPTPLWATYLFFLIGVLLIAACGFTLLVGITQQSFQVIPCNLPFLILGFVCVWYAARSSSQQITEPKEWTGPAPR